MSLLFLIYICNIFIAGQTDRGRQTCPSDRHACNKRHRHNSILLVPPIEPRERERECQLNAIVIDRERERDNKSLSLDL